MKLVVDVGNSRLKWALTESEAWHKGRSVPLIGRMDDLLDTCWAEMEPPSSVLVSNVSGEKNAAGMRTWIRGHWGRETVFFRSTACFGGLINGYDNPEQLGCDRWAAIIGARSLTATGALCVVDCGTAVTIDAVNTDDRFIGGVILPGIDLMQESLLNSTSDILENRAEFRHVVGTTTAQCVSGGSYIGTAGAIDRIVREMGSIVGDPTLYITGGDAPQLSPLLTYSFQHEPDLVLFGLAHTLNIK